MMNMKKVQYRTPNGVATNDLVPEDTNFIVLKKLQLGKGISWLKHTLACTLKDATKVSKEQGEFVIIPL